LLQQHLQILSSNGKNYNFFISFIDRGLALVYNREFKEKRLNAKDMLIIEKKLNKRLN
jgi:hypothetical protein